MVRSLSNNMCKCVDFLDTIGFLRQASVLESLRLNADFMSVAFRAKSYRDVYDVAVETQCFNFVMGDGAFFQFTEKDESSARYCYYPNPYSFDEYLRHRAEVEKISEEEDISWEECEQILAEGKVFNVDIPCIRYDKDYEAYSEDYHPVAHMHVGFFSDNRWPVRRNLSPYTFFLFVLRTYYQEKWIEGVERVGLDLDSIFIRELEDGGYIEDDYFSNAEARRVHIT